MDTLHDFIHKGASLSRTVGDCFMELLLEASVILQTELPPLFVAMQTFHHSTPNDDLNISAAVEQQEAW